MIDRRIHSINFPHGYNDNYLYSDFMPDREMVYWTTANYIRTYNITRFAKRPFAGAKRLTFVLGEDNHGFAAFVCESEPLVFLCARYSVRFGLIGKNTKKFSLWVK